MARRVFYSFHYEHDAWRAGTVRNMGVVGGNVFLNDNAWEKVKRGGDKAVKKWIDREMRRRSCVVVLIGSKTAGRKWINYEIEKAWADNKGIVGIHIHKLKDGNQKQSRKGRNPFSEIKVGRKRLSSIVKTYDLPYKKSETVYRHIQDNIEDWVEEAIQIRKEN